MNPPKPKTFRESFLLNSGMRPQPNNLLSAFQYIFQQTLAAWRTVFLIVSALYVCSVTQFLIFAKAAVQPWNTYWENEPKKNDIKEKP